MSRRSWWVALFLGVTAVALGGELLAAFDDSADTVPWTELLVSLPPWVLFPVLAVFLVWLPWHLVTEYYRKRSPRGAHAMSEDTIPPLQPPAHLDARNRALRTFAQGLITDVVVAVVMAVGPSLASSDFAFTKDYWQVVCALAAKTAVMTVVSYVARKWVPPNV